MANTTFSGPIRAGTIRNTVGTTVGTDVANVGYVVMGQGQTVTPLAAGTYQTTMVIPANSKIVNVVVDMSTAANTTTNISIGDTVGGNTTIVNTLASGTSAGLKTITTQGGGDGEWANTGTADLKLTVTTSATVTAGVIEITVTYLQAYNTVILP
jgi:hypothetical protein|tara:strand:+ start:320 stop:784 length:465 start_codon:yes stop_codon:yes gene_type:complete